MKNQIRINNIEYKETTAPNGDTFEEIVCWYPNKYYKAQEKMKEDGWTFDENGDAHRGNCSMSSGMFESEKHCYVIADVDWNRAHDEFNIRSIGTRAFDLEDKDYKDFKKVLKLISEFNHEEHY